MATAISRSGVGVFVGVAVGVPVGVRVGVEVGAVVEVDVVVGVGVATIGQPLRALPTAVTISSTVT
jgi:hypothetical protein